MQKSGSADVCIIVAAKDAADTIRKAISSALAEPQVAEVVVIDDASSDGTEHAAWSADDGSGRLKVLRFETNKGPSAARNRAIEVSSSPLIGILDADDYFFPGRFAAMAEADDWDLLADNIGFIHHDPAQSIEPERFHARVRTLSLVDFVEGNISRRGAKRGEIGFLKPIIRRAFLDRFQLRYDEELRLGEDYDLYLRALAHGARYKVIDHCGYAAVVRAGSLSGRHRTEDLRRLYEAERRIRVTPGLLKGAELSAVRRHERQIKARYDLRQALDVKAAGGAAAVLKHMARRPDAVPAIVTGVLGDKMEAWQGQSASEPPVPAGKLRYLLPAVPVAQK